MTRSATWSRELIAHELSHAYSLAVSAGISTIIAPTDDGATLETRPIEVDDVTGAALAKNVILFAIAGPLGQRAYEQRDEYPIDLVIRAVEDTERTLAAYASADDMMMIRLGGDVRMHIGDEGERILLKLVRMVRQNNFEMLVKVVQDELLRSEVKITPGVFGL